MFHAVRRRSPSSAQAVTVTTAPKLKPTASKQAPGLKGCTSAATMAALLGARGSVHPLVQCARMDRLPNDRAHLQALGTKLHPVISATMPR